MLYDVDSPKAYLEGLDPDWRKEKLLQLRSIIFEKQPEIKEGIEYKMLVYKWQDQTVFHLNAQRNYVSLYVGTIRKVDESGQLLAGLDIGKGCIRFKKNKLIEETRIDEFIEKAILMVQDNKDIDC